MTTLTIYLTIGLLAALAVAGIYLSLPPAERGRVDDGFGREGMTVVAVVAGVVLLWPAVLVALVERVRRGR